MPKDNFLDVFMKVTKAARKTTFLVSERELPLYKKAIIRACRPDLDVETL